MVNGRDGRVVRCASAHVCEHCVPSPSKIKDVYLAVDLGSNTDPTFFVDKKVSHAGSEAAAIYPASLKEHKIARPILSLGRQTTQAKGVVAGDVFRYSSSAVAGVINPDQLVSGVTMKNAVRGNGLGPSESSTAIVGTNRFPHRALTVTSDNAMVDNGVVPAPGRVRFGASTVSIRHNDDHHPVAPVAKNYIHLVKSSPEQPSAGQAVMAKRDWEQSGDLNPSSPSRVALTTAAHMATAPAALALCPLSPALASTAMGTAGRSSAAGPKIMKSLSIGTCSTLGVKYISKSSLEVDVDMAGDTPNQHHHMKPTWTPGEVRRSSSSGNKRSMESADSPTGMIRAAPLEESQDAVSDDPLDARLVYARDPDGSKDTTSDHRRRVRGCKQSSATLVGEP